MENERPKQEDLSDTIKVLQEYHFDPHFYPQIIGQMIAIKRVRQLGGKPQFYTLTHYIQYFSERGDSGERLAYLSRHSDKRYVQMIDELVDKWNQRVESMNDQNDLQTAEAILQEFDDLFSTNKK